MSMAASKFSWTRWKAGRLEAPAGIAKAAVARQRHDPDRPDPRPAPALLEGRRRGDQDADPVHRRRQDQRHAAAGAAYARGPCEGIAHRDDSRRDASDVRAAAAEILRDRAGFPGGLRSNAEVSRQRL